ncbi:MAG: hypothetical protein R3C49_22380 [Planctomycetaceae bacterium]
MTHNPAVAKRCDVAACPKKPTAVSMSIEQAERLKRELTDKWVTVAEGVPELRRFQMLTGKVRTVNMNCRALVQFDSPEDIAWYDIDPQFLTVVDGPHPKAKEETAHSAKAAAAPAKAAAPAASGGGSPLDQIRAKAGGGAPTAAPAGGSPLDKIRAAAAPKPAGGSPLDQIRANAGTPTASTGGGSPLDRIRAAAAAPAAASPTQPEAVQPEAAPQAETKPAAPAADPSLAGLSPLEQIRARGAFKG